MHPRPVSAGGSLGWLGQYRVAEHDTRHDERCTRNDTPGTSDSDPGMKVGGAIKKFHGKPVGTPAPAGQSVAGSTAFGFDALSHADQRNADNGNQFSIEPPDQALCVGNGYVLEGVNLAFRVYTQAGAAVTNPVSYNQFFTNDHAINRNVTPIGARGWFLSDPKCYYDPDTNRFFMTILGINPDGFHSAQFIAVTQTGDPSGTWLKYSFDTTDDGTNGTPNNPGCAVAGCFGDQPLLGADKYGIYITTNEFPNAGGFNGTQIYAMSKTGLENGTPGPLVHIVTHGLQEGPAYSVQPSTSPDANYDTANGGTEYFLSALDFNGALDGRIAAWTLTNTSSLNTASPNVRLQNAIMKSESYGQPAPAAQKPGPTPLGTSLGEPLEQINSNDDRMNQVVYAGGLVWGAREHHRHDRSLARPAPASRGSRPTSTPRRTATWMLTSKARATSRSTGTACSTRRSELPRPGRPSWPSALSVRITSRLRHG